MKLLNSLKRSLVSLSVFERVLWLSSVFVVIVSFLLGKQYDFTVLAATLVGVTALIFTAKGNVLGQVLIIIFSILYAIVSYRQAYYGEMISYVFMSGGIAAMSVVAWIKHPYSDGTVKVGHPSKKAFVCVGLLALLVTAAFYFILKALGTASLFFSTLSITTSFVASALTLLRSPYYAAAYALNDVVLIVLWIIASISDTSAIPMTVCFMVFLINDIYGFVSWLRMEKVQRQAQNHSPASYF